MNERKIESAELRMQDGETCRSGVFVKSVCEVRVRVRLGDTAAVTIAESFETTELGEAWRDGVVRGVDVAAPLWAQLDRGRALAAASAIDVAEKARRDERERIIAMIAKEARENREAAERFSGELKHVHSSDWIASSLRWSADKLETLANTLREDGAA